MIRPIHKGLCFFILLCTALASPAYLRAEESQQDRVPQVFIKPQKGSSTSYTSGMYVSGAWKALEKKQYKSAIKNVDKCVKLYSRRAGKQQDSLDDFPPPEMAFKNWALNDVATALFIKGLAFRERGLNKEAKSIFQEIIHSYGYALCYDPRGWFWKVADAAADKMLEMEKGVSFGDYTSRVLVAKSWNAFTDGVYEHALIYADKCIALYEKDALEQQSALNDFAKEEEDILKNWALNDVAVSYFIKGLFSRLHLKDSQAKEIFRMIMKKFSFAQCYDPRGWFWKVGLGAGDQIIMMEKGIDFGDYTSQELIINAWTELDNGDLDAALIYARKCIDLYREEAVKQQASLNDFAPEERAFDYWALNDVGTSYFIVGKILIEQKKLDEAEKVFKKLIEELSYAQCYAPIHATFWKVSVSAHKELKRILVLKSGVIGMQPLY